MDIIASSLALFYIFHGEQILRPMLTPWLNVMIYGKSNKKIPDKLLRQKIREDELNPFSSNTKGYRSESMDWTIIDENESDEDSSEPSEFIMEEINI